MAIRRKLLMKTKNSKIGIELPLPNATMTYKIKVYTNSHRYEHVVTRW